MKKLILSLVFFSLLSCSNNDDSNSNLQNETLSYKSWDDFMDSYTKLSENLSENSERVKQKIAKYFIIFLTYKIVQSIVEFWK